MLQSGSYVVKWILQILVEVLFSTVKSTWLWYILQKFYEIKNSYAYAFTWYWGDISCVLDLVTNACYIYLDSVYQKSLNGFIVDHKADSVYMVSVLHAQFLHIVDK